MNSTIRNWLVITISLIFVGCNANKPKEPMKVNVDAVSKLQALGDRDNFAPNGILYTGVHNPALRVDLNARFKLAVSRFILAVENKSTKDGYLALLASEIKKFKRTELETEDAEQVGTNFEHIMDCIGLENSEGILNDWMYGFDPTKL